MARDSIFDRRLIMIIRDFFFTIVYLMIAFCQTIAGTTIRYREVKKNKAYSNYADLAIFIEAVKNELRMQLSLGKFIAPIVILIDLILIWMK